MPLFRRPQRLNLAREGVLWGIARRDAASDSDDPLLHAGLTQHAFPLGNDERAICGFQPPVRSGFRGTRAPQLALPRADSPRCPSCVRLLGAIAPTHERSADAEAEVAADAGSAGTPRDEKSEVHGLTEAEVSNEHDLGPAPDIAEEIEPQGQSGSVRDEARSPKRTSVRRAGRITVPPGRRSVVTRLPTKLNGAAVTAELEGSTDDLRVLSVRIADDGTVRITLNQRTPTAVDLVLYLVSGPQRQ